MRKDIADFAVEFNDVSYERKSIDRILWGYPDLDYYTKGIEKGLTILQADTNMGKSVLTMQVLQNVSKQGYKACVFASEHTNESYKMLVMQQNAKKGEFCLVPFKDTRGNDTNIADWYVNEEVEQKVQCEFGKNIILFNSNKKERDVNTIVQWIEYCHDHYGCKFCLLDNFTEVENNANDIFQGQTAIITLLRDTLLRLDMMGVLVMHINKESASNGFRLTVKSTSGTANAGNKAYNMIALYRKDYISVGKGQEKMLEKFIQDCARCGFDYEKCDGFAEVVKTKGNGSGIVGLTYDSETKTYRQAEKISQTEADKIFRIKPKQSRIELTFVEEGDLPF
jgi:hypothetical protein